MKRWPWWEILFFSAFLFWSGAGLFFTVEHVAPTDVAGWSTQPWLVAFVTSCIRFGDPILILLAFASTHAQAARQWTPALARRWALIIVAGSLAIETLGVDTGLIFGDYHYTDLFGPMLGVVPMTIPLAWYVVVTNSLFVVRLIAPHSSRLMESALAAVICTIYDFVLEPFATVRKHYWIWQDGVIPLKNYVAWFVLSFLLIWFFAPAVAGRQRYDVRPMVILGLTVLIFLAGK